MNESASENMPMGAPPAPVFKDRSTGLAVFGILTIVLGCLAALMVLLMLAATAVGAAVPNSPPSSLTSVAMVVFIYGGLAVALIWLGIGSIKARRWARALILIFSWAWLVMGIGMVLVSVFFLPHIWANMQPVKGQPAMPAGAIVVMTIIMVLFFGIFFVIVPAIWVFFYGNHDTLATVETRDPIRRWTDACPLPVLALALWLLCSAPLMLLMPFVYHGVIPFFGVLLGGVPGSLVYVAIGALWAYCGWRLYNMDVRGWWVALIAMTLYAVSTLLTFTRHNILEMYQAMGYPQAQIDQLQKMGMFTGNWMGWMTLIFFVPFLGYIVYIKKYLPGDKVAQA